MSRRLKINASLTLVLAILFYLFFEITKHNPALSSVNVFADDPYDSVGSFGIQIALFAALLSLVRAFRPYQAGEDVASQELLLLRGEHLSCLSVAVTVGADIVALARHPAVWSGDPAGHVLAALLGGMALLTALVGWLLHNAARNRRVPSTRNTWPRASIIAIVSILLLALYPENWRDSIPGELLTILCGIAFLLAPAWAIGNAISPEPVTLFADSIDDLTSVYRWLKAHAGPLAVLCTPLEKIAGWLSTRPGLRWLNPRRHAWNLVIVLGIAAGSMLTLAEMQAEAGGGGSSQIGRLALIAAIFVSIECTGVLLGYAIFAQPLGLFRHTSTIEAGAA